jgi:RecJ-like exonuclease
MSESITICKSCGEKAHGEDIDMMYCRHCDQHVIFIEISDCPVCGGSGSVDEIDTEKVNGQTTTPPYHKVGCNTCNGESWVEA